MSKFIPREQLISQGIYSEEIIAKAEEIAWRVPPTKHKNAFERWPDWSGANMQTHFAALAKIALAEEKESKEPVTESVWVPWALLK